MSRYLLLSVLTLSVFATNSFACTGTINSLSDVQAAVACNVININGFTVPAGEGITLNLNDGTIVNLNGDISFGNKSWAGPLFTITGRNIEFNGNGHMLDGGGPFYWDGQVNKRKCIDGAPSVLMSGTFQNLRVLNSPARVFSVLNKEPLVMSRLTIDNSLGDLPNNQSHGKPAGGNTDGFDVTATDLMIQDCSIHNQDDCLAINNGSNILFMNNVCHHGHGISIGSVRSDARISNVAIIGNTITDSTQALRIKTVKSAQRGSVTNVTYEGNVATGCKRFGVLIDQSYPSTLGTPGTGVSVQDIKFGGSPTTISVSSGGQNIAINCGVGGCIGSWDWSQLRVTGGHTGPVRGAPNIIGAGY